MAAGATLTLTAGTDYLFSKTETWSGIKGFGTRGVVLETLGYTIAVTNLDHITGGRNSPGGLYKDVVTLAGAGGNTITVAGLETLIGSAGNDRVLGTSTGTTMAVESIETFIGASTGTALISLTNNTGNTMSVAYLKSLVGSAGIDVINFGAGGQLGTTTVVTAVETLIGTSGEDAIATVAGGSNTVQVRNIEVFLGNGSKAGDTVLLGSSGGTIGASFIETLIGSSANDVFTMSYKTGSIDMRSGGGTVSVSMIDTIVGGTSSRNAAILMDVGTTVTVSSLNTLIGGGGKDVVTMTFRDGTAIVGVGPVAWNTVGNTMQVEALETVIGTAGDDALMVLGNTGITMSVRAIETIIGKAGSETVLLAPAATRSRSHPWKR